jgi:hypothetical protein
LDTCRNHFAGMRTQPSRVRFPNCSVRCRIGRFRIWRSLLWWRKCNRPVPATICERCRRADITGGIERRVNLRIPLFNRLYATKRILSKLVRGFFFQQQPFFFGV